MVKSLCRQVEALFCLAEKQPARARMLSECLKNNAAPVTFRHWQQLDSEGAVVGDACKAVQAGPKQTCDAELAADTQRSVGSMLFPSVR